MAEQDHQQLASPVLGGFEPSIAQPVGRSSQFAGFSVSLCILSAKKPTLPAQRLDIPPQRTHQRGHRGRVAAAAQRDAHQLCTREAQRADVRQARSAASQSGSAQVGQVGLQLVAQRPAGGRLPRLRLTRPAERWARAPTSSAPGCPAWPCRWAACPRTLPCLRKSRKPRPPQRVFSGQTNARFRQRTLARARVARQHLHLKQTSRRPWTT